MLDIVIGGVLVVGAYWAGLRTGAARRPPPKGPGAGRAPSGTGSGTDSGAASGPAPLRVAPRDGSEARPPADLPSVEEVGAGIEAGEFRYFVQPVFDVPSGRAIGVEALSRWHRADGGLLRPDSYMRAMLRAYSQGLRPPISMTAIAARPFTERGMFCAFNVSSAFLDSEAEAGWVEEVLAPLDPETVVFEIVESSVISHPAQTRRLVDSLRERGVRFALDDFGTGLSNLERLQAYPVDFVKLDRRIVAGLGAGGARERGILSGLVSMSQAMGFDLVAEGVETEAERDRVAEAGIRLMQGYLLGRPAAPDVWAARLAKGGAMGTG